MIIYKTTNLINNKIYVGQDIKNNPRYLGSGKVFKQALKKYGFDNFKKEILEFCKTQEELNEREIFWIKELDATNVEIGYNISRGGRNNRTLCGIHHPKFGKPLSESTKNKLREKRKLQKMSEEEREKLRIKWTLNNPGKNKSPETIQKIKESLSKIDRTGENASFYGGKHSEETKKNWSIKRKGKNKGSSNPDAKRYYIECPDGEILIIETRQKVMETLGCSLSFFATKKYKKYKLIQSEKINKK